MEDFLDFLIDIGRLKRMPRTYWKARGIKNPETVAEHSFTLALIALIFGAGKRHLNTEKLLKMALCHEMASVYTDDLIPYYDSLPKDKKKRDEIFKKLPRLLKNKKIKRFSEDYKLEKNSVKKLVSCLDYSLGKEIIRLWDEYKNKTSAEGRFLGQINVLAVLLRALLYRKENKKFSVQAIWEWAFEICDDPTCYELMNDMKKIFHTSK